MSERKWTPGPWIWTANHPTNACANVRNDDLYVEIAICYGGDSNSFQDANGRWSDQPVRDANARLIAAAPDLYEALEEALSVFERMRVSGGGIPSMQAALAKARGEA